MKTRTGAALVAILAAIALSTQVSIGSRNSMTQDKLDPAKMGLPPGIPADVPHVITFKALGDKKTEITIVESGYTTDQAVETSKAGMQECLDKMAESLKG